MRATIKVQPPPPPSTAPAGRRFSSSLLYLLSAGDGGCGGCGGCGDDEASDCRGNIAFSLTHSLCVSAQQVSNLPLSLPRRYVNDAPSCRRSWMNKPLVDDDESGGETNEELQQ